MTPGDSPLAAWRGKVCALCAPLEGGLPGGVLEGRGRAPVSAEWSEGPAGGCRQRQAGVDGAAQGPKGQLRLLPLIFLRWVMGPVAWGP